MWLVPDIDLRPSLEHKQYVRGLDRHTEQPVWPVGNPVLPGGNLAHTFFWWNMEGSHGSACSPDVSVLSHGASVCSVHDVREGQSGNNQSISINIMYIIIFQINIEKNQFIVK